MKLGFENRSGRIIDCPSETQNRLGAGQLSGTSMLQSAIFADLQVNNFGIPTVRLAPRVPVIGWMKGSFAHFRAWFRGTGRGGALPTSEHLLRDIGLIG